MFMKYMRECSQSPDSMMTAQLTDKVCTMLINPDIDEV